MEMRKTKKEMNVQNMHKTVIWAFLLFLFTVLLFLFLLLQQCCCCWLFVLLYEQRFWRLCKIVHFFRQFHLHCSHCWPISLFHWISLERNKTHIHQIFYVSLWLPLPIHCRLYYYTVFRMNQMNLSGVRVGFILQSLFRHHSNMTHESMISI